MPKSIQKEEVKLIEIYILGETILFLAKKEIIQQFVRRQFAIENREKGKNQAKRKETGICK